MPLTDLQRKTLNLANYKGGARLERLHQPTVELLEAAGLITLHDHGDDGTWIALIAKTGRALLHRPLPDNQPAVFLAHAGRIRYRRLPNRRWAIDEDADGDGDYSTDPRHSIDHDQIPGGKTAAVAAVSPSDLANFAKHARQREAKRQREHTKTLKAMTPRTRLQAAQTEASQRRIDVTSDVRLINHMLTAGRTSDAEVALRRLETKLHHRAA